MKGYKGPLIFVRTEQGRHAVELLSFYHVDRDVWKESAVYHGYEQELIEQIFSNQLQRNG